MMGGPTVVDQLPAHCPPASATRAARARSPGKTGHATDYPSSRQAPKAGGGKDSSIEGTCWPGGRTGAAPLLHKDPRQGPYWQAMSGAHRPRCPCDLNATHLSVETVIARKQWTAISGRRYKLLGFEWFSKQLGPGWACRKIDRGGVREAIRSSSVAYHSVARLLRRHCLVHLASGEGLALSRQSLCGGLCGV